MYDVDNLLKKYPTKVPIILESKDIELFQQKFLVEKDISFGQFAAMVRTKNKLKSNQGLIFFIDNTLPPNSHLLSTLYTEHKSQDKVLYINVRAESVFG